MPLQPSLVCAKDWDRGLAPCLAADCAATGENLVEQIAAVGDYLVALETYRAAVKRWPKDNIALSNRDQSISTLS